MGVLDWLMPNRVKKDSPTWVEVDAGGNFYHYIRSMFHSKELESFDCNYPMKYAGSIAEIFTPIDIIAERVSSVDYILYSKKTGEPIENIPINLQALINKPNIFVGGLSDLVYQMMFSELATGSSLTLTKKAGTLKGKSYDYINSIWSLDPDCTEIKIKKQISDPFLIRNIDELVDSYKTRFLGERTLDANEVTINVITKMGHDLRPVSPLQSAVKNINNLLAVYSARYNVYASNGSAIMLTKEKSNAGDIEEQVNPVKRQQILDDIQSRDGITGNRNLVGISSIPLKAIETLGKIKDLEPFKETFADAIAIGGIYGVNKELLPKEDGTTFSNTQDVEKHLWQNVVIPYAEDMAKTLTVVYWLPDDMEFRVVTEHINILQEDRLTLAQAESVEIDNIAKLNDLGVDTSKHLEKWKN